MRTCRLAVLAVSLALVCLSSLGRSGETDQPKPPALGAPKEQTGQEVRILEQLFGLGQGGENRQIVTALPHADRGMGVWRSGSGIDYKIRVVRPDPNVDYKILLVRPDPKVDYKILLVRPHPSVDYKIRNFYPGGGDVYMVPRADGRKTVIIRPPPDGRDK